MWVGGASHPILLLIYLNNLLQVSDVADIYSFVGDIERLKDKNCIETFRRLKWDYIKLKYDLIVIYYQLIVINWITYVLQLDQF